MCMNEEERERFATPRIKFRGCGLEFWGGVVGMSEKLVVFDGEIPCCIASDLSKRSREALADGMIKLWARFRAGEVDPNTAKDR